MNVEELMTTDVVTVGPDTTLKEVAGLLIEHHISGVPVCDPDGRVLGVVSESDILWKELRSVPEDGGLIDRLLQSAYGDEQRERARTAGEAMSAPAITVDPGVPVARAAQLMLEYMVNRLPVVHDGRVVGVLTRADIVRAFRRPDEEIAREIRDELVRAMWVDPEALTITVAEGDVAIAGEVENHSTAIAIEKSIRRIPGVADLRSELTWEIDDRSRRIGPGASRLPRRI